MLHTDGWSRYSIWEHTAALAELYEARAAGTAPELTCHAQAAELLATVAHPGHTVLDAGCGSGALWHALRRRGVPVEYWGVDATRAFVTMAQRYLPGVGVNPAHLIHARLDDLDGAFDHIVSINVLSNLDHFHRPLDRFLRMARHSVILRESIGASPSCRWVEDRFLDPGVHLSVHVHVFDERVIAEFIRERGFDVRFVTDRHTAGVPEDVIGYAHHWRFAIATRREVVS